MAATPSLADSTQLIEPKILYPGTPVVLVSTVNPDGTPNLAPMSSFWALGWTAMLGLGGQGQTCANLERTGECVLNLPEAGQWPAVERLAPLSGRNPPPPHVLAYGGRHVADKFGAAGLEPSGADLVAAPRVREAPLQLEARLLSMRPLAGEDRCVAAEVRVIRVHAHAGILIPGRAHIDPARWSPLIYNFRRYHGLGPELGRSFREAR